MTGDFDRELKIKCKLYLLYNPDSPIADGYYASTNILKDSENINMLNRNAQNGLRVSLNNGSFLLTPTHFQNIPALGNALIPPPNIDPGAPECTFGYGSIDYVVHPTYDLIYSADTSPNFNILGISPVASGSTSKPPSLPQTSVPVPQVQIKSNNIYQESSKNGTYNIWKLHWIATSNEASIILGGGGSGQTSAIGQTYTLSSVYEPKLNPDHQTSYTTNDVVIYEGQNTKNIIAASERIGNKETAKVMKQSLPTLSTTKDPQGSKCTLSSPNAISWAKRIFPTSKDLIYENPTMHAYVKYSDGTDKKYTFAVTEKPSENCGFRIELTPTFFTKVVNGKNSKVIIRVISGIKDNFDYNIVFEINKPIKVQGYNRNVLVTQSDGTQDFLVEDFPLNIPYQSSSNVQYQVFFHIVNDILLIGFEPDASKWQVIGPVQYDRNSNNKIVHKLPKDSAYVYIETQYATCQFQYSPIIFNNFDLTNTTATPTITFRATPDASTNFSLLAYDGYRNIKSFDNGPNIYQDSRAATNPLSISVQPTQAVEGQAQNYAQVSHNGIISGSIFSYTETRSQEYDLEPFNSLLYPIEDRLGGDLSEWVESFTVTFNNEKTKIISGTASVVLKNFDAAFDPRNSYYKGWNILNLIEKNQLVVELSAGYNDEMNVFFQGFITQTKTSRSASGSVTTLSATDIGRFVLQNTLFQKYIAFSGAKYKYSFRRIMEHTGFYRRFLLIENPGYIEKMNLNMSQTALEREQFRAAQNEPIASMMNEILNNMNDQRQQPFFRYNPDLQYFVMDWRYDPAYRDSLNLFDLNLTQPFNSRNLHFNDLTDWHGVLAGPYEVTVSNDVMVQSLETRGLSHTGLVYYSWNVIQDPTLILGGDFNINGYIGFQKRKFVDHGRKFPDYYSLRQWAENEKVRFSKPNYIVDFSCYVKRPLHEHGTFVIESLWNGTRSVTDAYLYNSIEYICNKAENIITARVQGSQSYILQ